jgi:hypothetical protein
MSTYTPSLGLELITPGSQAGLWGNTTNNSLNLIDQAITGVTPISFASASGSTYTLTDFNGAEDESRAAVLNVTGSAIGANTIVIPNKQKTYLVRNNTGQDVTFRTPTPSATYAVGAGYSILIFCDGNNNVFTGIASPGVGTLSVNAGGTGATTFTAGFVKSTGGTNALTSSATVNAATELSGVVSVANGGTGQTSLSPGALLFGNGTGAVGTFVGGSVGQVATWNGSAWVAQTPTAGSVSAVNATAPLSSSGGTTPNISLSGIVPISNGGTGASTAAGALASLGAPSLSASQTWSGVNIYTGTFGLGGTGTTISGDGTAQLAFNVGGANRLQIFSTFTQSNQDMNFGGNIVVGSLGYRVGAINTNITGGPTALVVQAGGIQFNFSNSGNATAPGSWISSSDLRIKENITSINNGLATIGQLNPVRFSMKKDQLSSPNRHGLIAQELELVVPDVVHETTMEVDGVENVKAVAYTELIPILVKAIQELKAEVDTLKSEVDALKAAK